MDEEFPNFDPIWTCPKTGLKVPKQADANLRWRSQLLEKAERDEGFAADLTAACQESLLFWINSMAWTFRQKVTDPVTGRDRMAVKDERTGVNEVDVPFVTWPIQDQAISMIEGLITDGGDGLIDKSRDMGATWCLVATFHWFWLFKTNVSILWVSATASDVDLHPKINPDTVFYKHDYIDFWLPAWMRPPTNRVNMHRGNMLKKNSMDGEATTGNVGRGGRRTAIGFDEFAAVEDGFGMLEASADTTACRIMNSTPGNPGSAFTSVRNQAKAGEKQVKYIALPWWEHPDKGRGRYLKQDPYTGEMKYSSPWYEVECRRRGSPKEIARNLDMDHMASGDRFFDGAVVARHRSAYQRPPRVLAWIDFDRKMNSDDIEDAVRKKKVGLARLFRSRRVLSWHIWPELEGNRPDQTLRYVFGIDVAAGTGASNSVISVRCVETGEKVAEFADANTPPHDLARIVCAAGMIWGGAKGWPLLVWEANGPGGIFGQQILAYGYPNVYMDSRMDSIRESRSSRFGWHSNRQKKEDLLGHLRRAIARDDFINHSKAALDEADGYIYYEGGGLGPARLMAESESARATHGDRCIADALTELGVRGVSPSSTTAPDAPGGTIASRRNEARAKARERKMGHWIRRARGVR